MTVTAPSDVWEVRDGQITQHSLEPLDFDMPRATIEDLRGQDAQYNAGVVRDILGGSRGHIRNAVLLNSAAGLMAVDESAHGQFQDRFGTAIARAAQSIDSGAAQDVLDRWVRYAASA